MVEDDDGLPELVENAMKNMRKEVKKNSLVGRKLTAEEEKEAREHMKVRADAFKLEAEWWRVVTLSLSEGMTREKILAAVSGIIDDVLRMYVPNDAEKIEMEKERLRKGQKP